MDTIIKIAIGIIFVWFLYTRLKPTKGLRTLNAEDFKKEVEKSEKAMLIDVREPNEFKNGSITGATNIPLSQLTRRLSEIPKEQALLIYCQSGMRSKNAARVLIKNGYSNIAHLSGGISAWKGKTTRR
ncbi:rhodanese-like domain-containing protein [Paenibacillus peoriae]|uniref:rhodanese-like domain-containing protein n=1 Tax=Paenibacillus peoriae TaxID=59893 RepID=UPI003F997D83